MIKFGNLIVLCFFLFLTNCGEKKEQKYRADLIVKNAIIYSANRSHSFHSVLVVRKGLILDIGDNSLLDKYESDKVLDAKNHLILPGFIDSHVHFMDGAANLASVQLRNVKSPKEFIQTIADFVKTIKPGEWIIGGDWDHENWGGELPRKEWVDSITTENPIFLNRLDGHMSLANSKTLQIAGITDDIISPVGGEIVKIDGKVTGIFKDNAAGLIYKFQPQFSLDTKRAHLKNAMKYLNSNGITSVHDMGTWNDYETYKKAYKDELLTIRIYSNFPITTYSKLFNEIKNSGKGDDFLKIGGLKGFVDGSLGSHTAAFFEDFADKPGDRGFFVNTREHLKNWIKSADSLELQVMVHAIGDSANHTLLNIFEEVIHENGKRDRRFRIEHAQHLNEKDISRFKSLGVIPSMQPYHAIDDGRWAEKLIGPERAYYTYCFNSLLNAGTEIAFGSDWFVAPAVPLMGIYAAVTRRTLDDKNPNGWVPKQKIDVIKSVRAFTINAAKASFDEGVKGSLKKENLRIFVFSTKIYLKLILLKLEILKYLKRMFVENWYIVFNNLKNYKYEDQPISVPDTPFNNFQLFIG